MEIVRNGENISLTTSELRSAAKEWEHLCLMQRIVKYLARYYHLPLSANGVTEEQRKGMDAFYDMYHIPFEAIVSSAYGCDVENLSACSDQVYIFLSSLAQTYEEDETLSSMPEEEGFMLLLRDKEGQAPNKEIPTQWVGMGVFSQTSERMVIGDPYACKSNPGLATLMCPTAGLWSTAVQLVVRTDKQEQPMVAMLFAKAQSCPYSFRQLQEQMFFWRKANTVATGSGVVGIFDEAYFQDPTLLGIPPMIGSAEKWADACVELTNSYPYAGVLPHGVVSCSGAGEGQYDAYYLRDAKGRVMAIAVDYLLYGEW